MAKKISGVEFNTASEPDGSTHIRLAIPYWMVGVTIFIIVVAIWLGSQ